MPAEGSYVEAVAPPGSVSGLNPAVAGGACLAVTSFHAVASRVVSRRSRDGSKLRIVVTRSGGAGSDGGDGNPRLTVTGAVTAQLDGICG